MDDIADVAQRGDGTDAAMTPATMTDATVTDSAMARFRIAVAARPDWQERLGAIVLPDDFVATALELAADAGIALDREAVLATLNVAPIAVASFLPGAETSDAWPPLYWLPAQSARTVGGEPAFDWLWFGPAPFTDPFHLDWVRRHGFRPFGLMSRVRTDLATLVAGAAQEETLAPAGFIFHMSRCGSTLAAQMLAAVPDHIVMSEPEPVDAVVQWALTSGAPLEAQVTALRAVVAALGRDRSGRSSRYVLKLDAWHGFALPLFRAAFPDTPWLFLFRDPGEVLVSLRMQPGMQSAPGVLPAALIGFDPHAATSIEDYEARLFAGLFDRMLAALAEDASLGLAIHYPDLVAAMDQAVPAHFGFAPSAQEAQAMAAAATRDAKAPDQCFVDDAAAKQAQVSPAMATAIAAWLDERYAALRAAAWSRRQPPKRQ